MKPAMDRRDLREMTANCAICNGPGDPECPCESERLRIAINQAEKRWIETWIGEIRDWVTNNSVSYVTNTFASLKAHRKAAHSATLHSIPYYPMYVQYSGRPPLPMHLLAQLQQQIADADNDFKRGIDADWKACVIRYPEVLDYYYSLAQVHLPRNAEMPGSSTASGPSSPSVPGIPGIPLAPRPPLPLGGVSYGYDPMRAAPESPKVKKKSKSDARREAENIARDRATRLATPLPERPRQKRRESASYVVAGGIRDGRRTAPPVVPTPPVMNGHGHGFGRPPPPPSGYYDHPRGGW